MEGDDSHDRDLERWRRRFAPEIVGSSPALLYALAVAQRCADTDSTVLVTGESGTGKELLAQALHRASPRATQPFVAVNCAALPEALVESELFGHVRGAFTGAAAAREGRIMAAQGGTLFLDEIGDLPLTAQAKLLRALQERRLVPVGADRAVPFDVRLVCATHHDLDAMVDQGRFRLDLYYRISVIRTELPPLRDRPEDIVPLAEHFVGLVNQRADRAVEGIDASARRVLQTHGWRGNVRELANAMERAVVLCGRGVLSARDVTLNVRRRRSVVPSSATVATGSAPAASTSSDPAGEELDLKRAVKRVEQSLITQALARTKGNRTEAAALLGLNRTTLVEKLRKLA